MDDVLYKLNEKYGQEAPITVMRGKVHEYLGMTLDFSEEGKVKISMVDYIKKMLGELPKDMGGIALTPMANHLFQVNNTNPKKLGADMKELFHHNVAKLLFLCKRPWPDIQTSMAFLCTHVKEPNLDDYKKACAHHEISVGNKISAPSAQSG